MEKKILVVVDMQNDFIDGSLGTKEAQSIVDNVVKKINEFEGKIYVTRDTHTENYLETAEGKKLPVEHCIKDTDGWELNTNVQKALDGKDNVVYIDKPTFGSVKLANELHNDVTTEGYKSVQFVGLCTDICVVSNVMMAKAYIHEVDISVDAMCCAGVTPETHNAALETMKMCQIDIIAE